MIGKVSIGKSFYGCISYCLDAKDRKKNSPKRGEILYANRCFGKKNQLIRQFQEVAKVNKNCTKPVWHTTLSFSKNDLVEEFQKVEIAQKFAEELGCTDHQYLVIQHNDTEHDHFHIIINRIGLDGKALSTSNNYKKISAFCRKIEIQYNLEKVLSPNAFLAKGERQITRNDTRKELMKQDISNTINKSASFSQFTQQLESKGYKIEKGRGISFIDPKKVKMKGSDLGFSLQKINQLIESNKRNVDVDIYRKRDFGINL